MNQLTDGKSLKANSSFMLFYLKKDLIFTDKTLQKYI